MATLHLMCGLPGAGKTTRAIELERSLPALRLTPDEWIFRVLGPTPDKNVLNAARDPVESLLWDVAARALALGINVILDFGFWSRSEREDYRGRAAVLQAGSELHFVDASSEVLLARLASRVAEKPLNTFTISPAQMAEWSAVFEPPTAEELVPRAAP